MERSKYIVIFVVLIHFITSVKAGNKEDIYKAYISNNMQQWKKVIDVMHNQPVKNNAYMLELLNYQYGYIAWCIGNKKVKEASEYIKKGDKYMEVLEKSNYKLSVVNAYKSAFYGYKIGLSKLKAPVLGPKSVECAKLSIKQDANNPFGYIQYGNALYYMPSFIGGSKDVALENYLKAEKLMDNNKDELMNDWNYLNLLTVIANVYVEKGDKHKAKSYYDKILKAEPNYLWVKNELYPQLLKENK